MLAAIVPGRRDLLIEAMQWLEPDHFRTEQHRVMGRLLVRFYDQTADVLTREVFSDLMQRP